MQVWTITLAHSFRIRAATTAAAVGGDISMIQQWKSNV